MRTYRVLLIGNGEAVTAHRLAQLAREADYILAADGGAQNALQAHLTPHGIIGDLDSLSTSLKKHFRGELFHVPTQENTDLEKALHWAIKKHTTHLTLVGFVGKRWDFSIANMLTLATYAQQLHICIVGENWRIYALTHNKQLACAKNKRLSLIPITPCSGVTLSGCSYPLKNECLTPGTTRTLSNQTTAAHVRLRLASGTLLLYIEGI